MYVHPDTDQLPGEPRRVRAATAPFAVMTTLYGLSVTALLLLTLGLWPLALLGVAVWGWVPCQPRADQVLRYLKAAWTERPPPPGIPPLSRVWLSLCVLQKVALTPLRLLAWHLDELLYGRRLRDTPVVAPVIVLSAARSGSTQIARYLEEDPGLAAPAMIQCVFPYLWLWRLTRATLGRVLPAETLDDLLHRSMTREFIERHELDALRTDSFEVMYFALQLIHLSPMFGPAFMADEFVFAGTAAHNRRMWDQDFPAFIDRLGRKTLLFSGLGPDGAPRRLFIKGHFLDGADAVARRFPDARFLTVIRKPISRIRSQLNHMHGNPFEESLGAAPWAWLTEVIVPAEVAYCRAEQAWFTRAEGPARTVVRFSDYVSDLEGTMRTVYRACLDTEALPPHVPTEHAPRERTSYTVNRSLEQLGVDSDAVEAQLQGYIAWCAT
ncbi:MAG: sulfotransferase [Alphaproteobacteria bacterium]|nr:sulfotransferase [Alphaproteobacteria bacterium]